MPEGGGRRIVIVGGGFSGTAAAIQLVRRSLAPLSITVVEPRERVGGGLAYSSDDADHRLNGQPRMHGPDPTDTGMFPAWCEERSAVAADPDARTSDGSLFMRRAAFRRFLEEAVAHHSRWPTGSTIDHRRDTAVDVVPQSAGFEVKTARGAPVPADIVILASGHTRARLPEPLRSTLPGHPGVITDPLARATLPPVPANARVLVLGSGLTAYDAASTILRAGHRGTIDIVSRRGLRPRPQRPPPAPGMPPLPPMLERTSMQPAPFILNAGHPPTVRSLLYALRAELRAQAVQGIAWDAAFDHLRDMVGQLWPQLALVEKRRFFRQLRPWYDVHRFRVPPQNSALVHAAEARGQVRFRAASIQGAASIVPAAGDTSPATGRSDQPLHQPLRILIRPRGSNAALPVDYDCIINCTGVDAAPLDEAPLMAALLRRGLIQPDPSGVGLAVDRDCRAIGAEGQVSPRLRIIGPPTAGAQGDPLGSAFIALQVHRIVPGILDTVG